MRPPADKDHMHLTRDGSTMLREIIGRCVRNFAILPKGTEYSSGRGCGGVAFWCRRRLAIGLARLEERETRFASLQFLGRGGGDGWKSRRSHFPQHFLYFLPLPQGQGSFRPILGAALRIG
jgi:hypothetical protein